MNYVTDTHSLVWYFTAYQRSRADHLLIYHVLSWSKGTIDNAD